MTAQRRLGFSLLFAIVAFILLGTACLYLYPGGTVFSRRTVGYHFWHNFICDALMPRAFNGKSHLMGSRLGLLAMACIAFAGLFPLWVGYTKLFASRLFFRISSALASTCVLGVLLLMSEAFGYKPLSHTALILCAAVPGACATILIVGLQLRNKRIPRHIPLLGCLALLASLTNLILYLRVQYWRVRLHPILPASQKIAMLLILLWLGALGWYLLQHSPKIPPSTANTT